VLPSQEWTTPTPPDGRLRCDGPRQERALASAAAAGGAVYAVPEHSIHASFGDIPAALQRVPLLRWVPNRRKAPAGASADATLEAAIAALDAFLRAVVPAAGGGGRRPTDLAAAAAAVDAALRAGGGGVAALRAISLESIPAPAPQG